MSRFGMERMQWIDKWVELTSSSASRREVVDGKGNNGEEGGDDVCSYSREGEVDR